MEIISIIGRPNVGKSTIFNKIIHRKKSVISDVPGTTRDRVQAEIFVDNKKFLLIDTGGIQTIDKNNSIEIGMMEQTEIAIDHADYIVFVLDGLSGLFPEDREIIKKLQKLEKKYYIVINKVDSQKIEQNVMAEFQKIGINYMTTSAINGVGISSITEKIASESNQSNEEEFIVNDNLHISLVGKPNVGKSSIMNALTGKKVSIVSEIAGTTRDAIDTDIEYDGKKYTIVDTAGIRKKSKKASDIEYYSYIRSLRAIERSEIVVLVIDATQLISSFEKSLIKLITESNKGCLIAINKWDKIEKETRTLAEYTRYVRAEISYAKWIPLVFVSAKDTVRLAKILEIATDIYKTRGTEVKTSFLNSIIQKLKINHPPPKTNQKSKQPKLFFMSQCGTHPPSFKLKVNNKKYFHNSYKRYLENRLREEFNLVGTPINIEFVSKEERY